MSKAKIETVLSSQDMNHLWGEVNKARDGTVSIKVNREVITRLLLDHGKLLNYYERGV